jgi:tetratricopeptide (TPR) repeat protein
MKLNYFLTFWLLFICVAVLAQDQSNYNSSGKKIEKKILRLARKQYNLGNYNVAIQKYTDLLKMDSTNPTYNFEIAQTYYDNFKQPLSISYFEKALRYSKDTLGEAYFFLGSALHLASRFDEAAKNYSKYLNLLLRYGSFAESNEQADIEKDVRRRIEMCENGLSFSKTIPGTILLNKAHAQKY